MNDDQQLEASFQAAEQAKTCSKELLKTTIKYRENAEACCESGTSLAQQLHVIYTSNWIKESPHIDVAKYLRYLGTTFNAVNSLNSKMVKDMQKTVVEPLQNFCNYDFLEMHDAKKKCAVTASEYEGMRQKIENAMITQSKKTSKGRGKKKDSTAINEISSMVEQYNTELERLKEEQDQNQKYLATVIEQTHQKKETKLLKHMLTLLDLQYNYHDKAFKLLTHLKQKMSDLHLQLDESCKEMSGTKEGHLMLKSSSMQAPWQKYWFVLKDGWLNCYKGKKDVAAMELSLNIMYCTTRIPMKAKNLNFAFEIVTPDKKKPLVLQAESEEDRSAWVTAIQQAIEEQLNQNEPAVVINDNDSLAFKILSSVEGNSICADCSAPNPDWASINLGVLLCLECSGVHRNLGTHISKVRSTTLDTKAWEPELLQVMTKLGNRRVNEIYEANISTDCPKPPPEVERATREKFIRAKYADKSFIVKPNKTPDELASDLYLIICDENDRFLEAFQLITYGANLDWKNTEDEDKTPIHCAVVFDKLCYLKMMVLNGGDIFCTETRNWTPMHYAAYYHRVYCAVVLHRHGFSGQKQLECKDWQNKTAIELALKGGCDEIVSLLNGEKKLGVGFTIDDLAKEFETNDSTEEHNSQEELPTPPPSLPSHSPTPSPSPTSYPLPQLPVQPATPSVPSPVLTQSAPQQSLPPIPQVQQMSLDPVDRLKNRRSTSNTTPSKLVPPQRIASLTFVPPNLSDPKRPGDSPEVSPTTRGGFPRGRGRGRGGPTK